MMHEITVRLEVRRVNSSYCWELIDCYEMTQSNEFNRKNCWLTDILQKLTRMADKRWLEVRRPIDPSAYDKVRYFVELRDYAEGEPHTITRFSF
jgi:hypothetical protein